MSDLSFNLSPESIEAIAERVVELQRAESSSKTLGLDGLISFDQLLDELPEAKERKTWRRWIYERVRRPDEQEAMGATKLGGTWFFDRAKVTEWLSTRW